MRKERMISDVIIQSIDITNTLNGGISQPEVKLTNHTEYRQIELKVPGVSEENMHVKINNNQLVVHFEIMIESRGRLITIPFVAYNKQIPYFIDANKIHAKYTKGVLTVQLPYNELANGYHREIPIEG
jgi:HSP20 family molecular chaperone IbpA